MTLNRGSLLKYRGKLVKELAALDVVLDLFSASSSPSRNGEKRKTILKEVKASKKEKSKFTKAQRKAMSLRMKALWKSGKLGKKRGK